MSNDLLRQHWTALIDGGHLNGTTLEARRRYGKVVRYLLAEDRRGSVADIGCGTGTCLRVLRQLGFSRLVGVEMTEAHVREARKNNPAARYVVADGAWLPFKSGAFDFVVSTGAIEHYLDPFRGIAEFARIARRKIVVSSDCYVWRLLQLLGLYRSMQPVDRAIHPLAFLRAFRENGLIVRDYDGWGITHYVRGLRKLLSKMRMRRPAAPDPPRPLLERHALVLRKLPKPFKLSNLFWLDENVFCVEKPRPSASPS